MLSRFSLSSSVGDAEAPLVALAHLRPAEEVERDRSRTLTRFIAGSLHLAGY